MAKAPAKKTPAAAPAKSASTRKAPAPVAETKAPEPEAVEEVTETQAEPEAQADISAFDLYLDIARAIDGKFENPAHKESEQAFYKRLVSTVASEAEDAEGKLPLWDSLASSELGDLQPWYNDAVDALEKGQPVKALSGYSSYVEKRDAAKEAAKPGNQKGDALKAYRERVAAEKAAGTYVKPERKVKEKAEKAPKDNITEKVRDIIVVNLDKSLEQLREIVKAQGLTVHEGTLATQRYNVHSVASAFRKAGLIK